MEHSTARRIVAEYLAGQRVAEADLTTARAALAADPDFCEFLQRERSPALADPSLCDVFAARSAEYCELAPAEQAAQFPTLTAHLADCDACRWIWQRIQPFTQVSGSGEAGTHWRAATLLSLTVNEVGEVQLAQPAPPFVGSELAAAVGGLLGADEMFALAHSSGQPRTWTIGDPSGELDLELTIAASPQDFTLVVRVLAHDEPLSGDDFRLEIWDEARTSSHLAGPGAQLFGRALVLPLGAWVAIFERQMGSQRNSWEVHLRVEGENGD